MELEAPAERTWAPSAAERRQPWRQRIAAAGRAPAWWPWLALGILLLESGALIAYETRGTTFWADEWLWILLRRGSSVATFLNPHNEHLSLVPIVIYKLLFATVGLHSYWPYRAVAIAAQLGCVTLVFVYARS